MNGGELWIVAYNVAWRELVADPIGQHYVRQRPIARSAAAGTARQSEAPLHELWRAADYDNRKATAVNTIHRPHCCFCTTVSFFRCPSFGFGNYTNEEDSRNRPRYYIGQSWRPVRSRRVRWSKYWPHVTWRRIGLTYTVMILLIWRRYVLLIIYVASRGVVSVDCVRQLRCYGLTSLQPVFDLPGGWRFNAPLVEVDPVTGDRKCWSKGRLR